MSRKSAFIEKLKKNQKPAAEDIIFYSQTPKDVFKDIDVTEEEERSLLQNLISYLPCSKKLIDEYLGEVYNYPNCIEGGLFNKIRDILNEESRVYNKLLEDTFNDFSSEISKRYSRESEDFNSQLSNKFKEALNLEIKIKDLKSKSEELRKENSSLKEIDIATIKKDIQTLKSIKTSIGRCNVKIESLKKII